MTKYGFVDNDGILLGLCNDSGMTYLDNMFGTVFLSDSLEELLPLLETVNWHTENGMKIVRVDLTIKEVGIE